MAIVLAVSAMVSEHLLGFFGITIASFKVGGSGVLAPKGTPAAILKKLETDLRSVLTSAEVREQYAANGLMAVGSSSAEFAAYMKSEIARWAPLIRASGATVD